MADKPPAIPPKQRCPICGTWMSRFTNPPRLKCPTPERHRLKPTDQGHKK